MHPDGTPALRLLLSRVALHPDIGRLQHRSRRSLEPATTPDGEGSMLERAVPL